MTVLVAVALTCTNCGAGFETQKVQSTNSFGGKRTDFHEKAAGASPLPWNIYTCPVCGYSAVPDRFTDGDVELKDSTKAKIWDTFPDELIELAKGQTGKFVIPGSVKYDWAAKILIWEGGGPGTSSDARRVGDLYTRAAWCAVEENDTEAERYYRVRAAGWLETALNTYGEVEGDERAVITYLVGEMWRRAGFAKRAIKWFEKVAGEVTDETAQQWILDAANQQLFQPREWFG